MGAPGRAAWLAWLLLLLLLQLQLLRSALQLCSAQALQAWLRALLLLLLQLQLAAQLQRLQLWQCWTGLSGGPASCPWRLQLGRRRWPRLCHPPQSSQLQRRREMLGLGQAVAAREWRWSVPL